MRNKLGDPFLRLIAYIHESDKVDEAALKDLIRAAVALNLKGKSKHPAAPTTPEELKK